MDDDDQASLVANSRLQKLTTELFEAEILTRLPIKYLYRCKCVRKSWCSTIKNPKFMALKRRRRRHQPIYNCGLLVRLRDFPRESLFYATLEDPAVSGPPRAEKIVCRLAKPFSDSRGITEVINGLACIFDEKGLSLCNVCTGETMSVPAPKFRDDALAVSYYLGFDSTNRVYKLLRSSLVPSKVFLHRVMIPQNKVEWEILTLGCGHWRKVANNAVLSSAFAYQSICVDGVLYWMYILGHHRSFPLAPLVAFDLSAERFHMVMPPEELAQSEDSSERGLHLVQFEGSLALLQGKEDGYGGASGLKLDVWVLRDFRSSSWTNVTIVDVPTELHCKNSSNIIPAGNFPTGELLLANPGAGKSSTTVYSYNHVNRTFNKFVTGKFPPLPSHINGGHLSLSCLEENTDPLNMMIRSNTEE